MEKAKAKLFVNSPNALDGNNASKCDSSTADFQSTQSGIVDVVADEDSIFAKIRELVTMLPGNNEDDASYEECTDDLNRVCAASRTVWETLRLRSPQSRIINCFLRSKKILQRIW